MFQWLKNLLKKKPEEPCTKCKGAGEILRPAFKIGRMIEYDVYKCDCKKK